MKRLITYEPVIGEDGAKKGIIRTISEPVDTSSITFNIDDSMVDNAAFVEADIPKPAHIPGKKATLLYDIETSIVEVVYEDIEESELTGSELLIYLREQNKILREELELTQAALFEIDNKVNGGAENE